MLNQNDDRRRLEEIERHLWDEDPEFVRRFTRLQSRGTGVSRVWPILVLVVGALEMGLALLVALPAVFILSVATMAGGMVWLRRCSHPGDGRVARRKV
jgi:hypothetical protein